MARFAKITIPLMVAGLILALLYAVFSASSKTDKADPVAKFATGALAKLETTGAGDLRPDATFEAEDGTPVQLADFGGQLILVNFWATWCAPCEREMPSLAALQTARGGDRFKVIAISVDAADDRDFAVDRLRELSGGVLDFYTLHAQPEGWNIVYDSGAGGGFPTSLLYGPDGVKIAKLAGDADWNSYEAVGLIDALLDG